MHLAKRSSGGYRVHYAISDVAAFVTPGGPLDAEVHRRVTTLYFPDGRVPLHPAVLSEDAASLLPDRTRPALLWRFDLDSDGRVETVDVRRALVRSRAKLDYDGVQKAIDTGTAEEPLALLEDVGRLREALEQERGGISLNVPEQEVAEHDGTYSLAYRAPLPADGWNAQISLMTGMASADLMLATGTGVLRTLPSAPDGAVGKLRRAAKALRIDWPHHVPYAELVRSLDPHRPAHAAFLQECTALLRGAGYTVFTGGETPDPAIHSAVAAPYAHCTAPLRRLADRYAGELCVAAVAGAEPRSGRWRPWTRSPGRWRRAPGWRTRSSGSPWTSSRRPCSRTASARPSRPRSSTSTTGSRWPAPSTWRSRRSSDASSPPRGRSRWATASGSG